MTNNLSSQEEKIRSFWDRYVRRVHESGVQPPFDRWMVRRAEQYIAAHPDRRLSEPTPADVDAYLAELGRQPGLKGWQFRQAVDAIQKLFELVGVDWIAQVDWAHWRDSARELGADHPTVARDYGPVPQGLHGANPLPGPPPRGQGAESDGEGVSFAAIRQAHGRILEGVAATIRVRGLSIRTEQSYLHWIMRFIGFLGNQDPTAKGAEEVAAFLEHLALERKVSASTQNLALNALIFLYREVLKREDLDLGEFARAKRPRRLPTVLTHGEVTALLDQLAGTHWLMASLMYGTGMRLTRGQRGTESVGCVGVGPKTSNVIPVHRGC
jgi:hypothetical protein